jgi:hypothetical protein
MENVDLYALPIFEAYEMYDDYLRAQPAFANDWYLKEITDNEAPSEIPLKDKVVEKTSNAISSIINKLRAIIKSLWNRMEAFYKGKSFGNAKKWVTENEKALRNLQFPADAKIEILPYKDDISLPEGFSKLKEGLMAFKEDDVKDAKSIQNYLQTLYPSPEIAKWFADDPEGKVSAQKYMNLILFDEGSDKPKDPVVVTGPEIAKKMDDWINTIKGSDAILASFKKINDDIDNAVGSINSKIVNITNANKKAAEQNVKNNDPNKPQDQNAQVTPTVDNAALLEDAGKRITSAISRLWAPISPMVIRAMTNEYTYIKTAYSLGQASHQQHTPEVEQQPEKGQL